MNPEIRRRLFALYAEVDAAVAAVGPICDASGRCCRFKEYDHALFISQIEAEALIEAAPAFEQPVSAEFCPFQKDNLCTAREPRPLGCRIYYCDPSYQDTMYAVTESSLRKIKAIAEEFETGWRYAPLHLFLNEAKLGEQDPASADKTSSSRIALPLAVQ